MNYSMVMYIVGWILNFEAAFMLPSCLVAVIYQEKRNFFFDYNGSCTGNRNTADGSETQNKDFHSREGFAQRCPWMDCTEHRGGGTICDKRSDSKSGGSVV